MRRLDAARQIARRELRRLTELARSRQIGEDEMRHLVAFNGLAGGLPITDLRKTVADELTISRRPTDQLSEVVGLLEQEFPARSGATQQPRLATIQPDLIGEAAIVEAFTGELSREAEAAETIQRAYELGARCRRAVADPRHARFRLFDRRPKRDRRGEIHRAPDHGLALGARRKD